MNWLDYGMERSPFRPAVDTAAYFPAPSHEAALSAIAAAFARRDPIVLVDGPLGVGKSLVARKWLDDLLPDVPRVVITNANAARPADFLQAILFDLGKPYQGLSEQELRLAVTEHLLEAASNGFPTVLAIDEAHHMSQSALEELRMLGNLETHTGAATFSLLIAHPMLRDALHRPAYCIFADRVAMKCALEPLTPEESVAYLRHQVRAAGGDPAKVFSDDAVSLLAAACAGLPRMLNRAAVLAFEIGASAENEVIDVEAAYESLTQLGIDPPEEDGDGDAVLLPLSKTATDDEHTAKRKTSTATDANTRGLRGAKVARKRTA